MSFLIALNHSSNWNEVHGVRARMPATDTLAARLHATFQCLAVASACILIFIRFGMMHQLLTFVTGINSYALYVFGIPAIIGIAAVGGIARTVRYGPAAWWLAFGLWTSAIIPFSIWKGGSLEQVLQFLRSDLIMIFIVAGVVFTWRDIRRVLLVMAAAASVSLLASRMFQVNANDRLALGFGMVANANDFAAHLLFVLPFLLWVGLSRLPLVLRGLAIAGVGYGTYIVLASGSRGAVIALAADIIFFTLNARTQQWFAFWAIAPLVITVAFFALPHRVVNRMLSFSATNVSSSDEALASSDAWKKLLRESLICTLRHPVFGIGPGQFTTYQGLRSELRGTDVYWRAAHNSFAQAASETGIPGLVFYVGGVLSTMSLLKKAHRRSCRARLGSEVTNALFCMRLGLVGFCTSIFFLNFTYSFYLPTMAGLAIACWRLLRVITEASATSRVFVRRS